MNHFKQVRMYLVFLWLAMIPSPTGLAGDLPFTLEGFREVVWVVSDLEQTSAFWRDTVGWEIRHKANSSQKLKKLWQLPPKARLHQVLLANPGTQRGFLRLVKIEGLPQVQIRPNAKSWDTGGIFDFNMRVLNLEQTTAKFMAAGWKGYSQPVQFRFDKFVVGEWLPQGPDGVVLALIERIQPPLEGWPHLKTLSRIFNATMVVRDITKERHFFENVLGFKPYIEHEGAGKSQGPNVLGLPHNLNNQIVRQVYILHPQGINEGSIELLAFKGASGENFSSRAKPPNLGLLTLRFPVKNLAALRAHLTANQIKINTPILSMDIPPYGPSHIFAATSPEGTWLEFFETKP